MNLINEAFQIKDDFKNGLIDFRVATKLLEPYADYYLKKGKELAKNHKKTAYPLDIKRFLGNVRPRART